MAKRCKFVNQRYLATASDAAIQLQMVYLSTKEFPEKKKEDKQIFLHRQR